MLLKTQYIKAMKLLSIAFILISFIWSVYYTYSILDYETSYSIEKNTITQDTTGSFIIIYFFAFGLGAYWNMGCIRKMGIL